MKFTDLDIIIEKLNNELSEIGENRVIVWILGDSICSHGLCFHCSLHDNLFKEKLKFLVKEEEPYEKFERDLERYNFSKGAALCLYLMGSFYNDKEVNPNLRKKILYRLSREEKINKVVFESRPEFIESHKILETKEILGKKTIEIGIGLDHFNEVYRNKYLNKNIKIEDYDRCAEILMNLKVAMVTYVALGCPYLNESEAIESSIETALYAIKKNSIVSLEPLQIQNGTIQEKLYLNGEWQPVYLWSIIEVIKKILNESIEIRVGGLVQAPVPYISARNCSSCNQEVLKSLRSFNSTQSIEEFYRIGDCLCKKDWEKKKNISTVDR